jgi:hypothetical protein
MAGKRYVIVAVECTHCKARQRVHVKARPDAAQTAQSIPCIQCNRHFLVIVPDKIVSGPFPA